jgi:hypothetical protein
MAVPDWRRLYVDAAHRERGWTGAHTGKQADHDNAHILARTAELVAFSFVTIRAYP